MTSLSIVIPTHDDAVALGFTLRSLAADGATREPGTWEVVVVDDGSTDHTAAVLAATTDLPLVTVHQQQRGRAAARNAGAAAASGEVLVFCDADRAPGPGFLAGHAAAHARSDDVVALGDVREVYLTDLADRGDEVLAAIAARWEPFARRWRRPAFVATVLELFEDGEARGPFRWLAFLSGNVSLRAELLRDVGGFSERFTEWGFEHFELGYRLAAAGARFGRAEAPSYHLAHSRPAGFYDRGIATSAALFRTLHPEAPVDALVDLVQGRATLEELSRAAPA